MAVAVGKAEERELRSKSGMLKSGMKSRKPTRTLPKLVKVLLCPKDDDLALLVSIIV